MTDQEKAATFIGWCPSQKYECGCDQKYAQGASHYNEAGNRVHWHDSGPAPDMSDPRNYMKALQELEFRHPWKVEFHIDADHYEFVFWMPNVPADGDGTFFRYTPKRARNQNESFAEALAALYDAEHAKENA